MNGPPEGAANLGHGHYYTKVYGADSQWVGIHEWHRSADGNWHATYVAFNAGANPYAWPPIWSVEADEPLSIDESVLCECGEHGWIRDGRWVRV